MFFFSPPGGGGGGFGALFALLLVVLVALALAHGLRLLSRLIADRWRRSRDRRQRRPGGSR